MLIVRIFVSIRGGRRDSVGMQGGSTRLLCEILQLTVEVRHSMILRS